MKCKKATFWWKQNLMVFISGWLLLKQRGSLSWQPC